MGQLIWVLWAVVGFGLEMFALWEHNDGVLPPLTHVVLWHIPRWILAMALGWLAFHFLAPASVGGGL